MNSRIAKANLDNESLTKLQADRAELVQSLSQCVRTAQELDDKAALLGVHIHTDSVNGQTTNLEAKAKLVSYPYNITMLSFNLIDSYNA